MEDEEVVIDPKEHSENRQFVRTRADIPVQFNVIDETEYQALRNKIRTEPTVARPGLWRATVSRRDDIDGEIRDYLNFINSKLDYLVGLITVGPRKRAYGYRALATELSGSGLKVETDNQLDPQAYLDICLELNFFPFFIDNIFGRIKRLEHVTDTPGIFDVAVEFVDLEESITEELVQLTFERQRQFLRRRRGKNRFDLQP